MKQAPELFWEVLSHVLLLLQLYYYTITNFCPAINNHSTLFYEMKKKKNF